MNISWLHISDLHYHFSVYETIRIREELIKRIEEFTKNNKIDFVFCSGDLADKNGRFNAELKKYLEDIAKAAGVIKQNVIIVPGNHDHDRNSNDEILNKVYKHYDDQKNKDYDESSVNKAIDRLADEENETLLDSFHDYVLLCKEFYEVDEYSVLTDTLDLSYDGIKIAKINTCLYERSSDRDGELHIGVKYIHQKLRDSNFLEDTLNIAIGHHPTSLMDNEEKRRFLDCLKTNNVNFYLCGHNHRPDFINHRDYELTEVVCGYGNSDDYYKGGFSIGVLDTELDQCYVDFYVWKNGSDWVRDTTVDNCDETGRCYIKSGRYSHISVPKIAIPMKLYGSNVPNNEIVKLVGTDCEFYPYVTDEIDINTIDWNKEISSIKLFAKSVQNLANKQVHVFPLAPVPLLITFGYELQNNSRLELYQLNRDSNIWVKNTKDSISEYNVRWIRRRKIIKNRNLIVKIATSTEISKEQLLRINGSDIIELSLVNKKLGMPLYENHYKSMVTDLFDELTKTIGQYKELHLFASVPAGMAIEIGRHIQKGVFPKVYLYNYYQKYTHTNILNEL